MPSAPMNRNRAKFRLQTSVSRPSGANAMAEARSEEQLMAAATFGNRATRRLAARNLRRVMRADQGKR